MATKSAKPALSAQQAKMIKAVRDSKAIDFDRLGKLVTQVGPAALDPGSVADDYVVVAGSSFLRVYVVGDEGALGKVDQLKKLSPAVQAPKAATRAKVRLPAAKK